MWGPTQLTSGLFILALVNCEDETDSDKIIKSKRITTWGEWGAEEKCPPNHFVNSVSIKYETWYGAAQDDTALNGITLHCAPVHYKNKEWNLELPPPGDRNNSRFITSKVGPWGKWLVWNSCPNDGLALSFQLRSQEYQGDNSDDTAANDITLICMDKEGKASVTDQNGGTYGEWYYAGSLCPKGHAVCGIKTQIEANQGKGDDTALNSVDLICCPLPPNPGRKCKATESFVRIWGKIIPPNSSSQVVKVPYKAGLTRGRFDEVRGQNAILESLAFSNSFGDRDTLKADLKANFDNLKVKFPDNGSQYDWSGDDLAFSEEKMKEFEVELKPGCNYVLSQLVGQCGTFISKSDFIKNEEEC